MIKYILPEEIESVRKNIETFPDLKRILREDFIKSLLKIEERQTKHQLFFILRDLQKTARLSNNLMILESKFRFFRSVLHKLLDDRDIDNFYSAISEIEVLSYFYNSFSSDNLEYEPPIERKTGKPDLRLSVNGEDYYIEIFNLRDDPIQREINYIQDSIKQELDKIKHSFSILFSTELSFKKENIEEFVSFANSLLAKKEQIKNCDKFEFFKGDSKLADIEFFNSKSNQGHVASMLHPIRILNDSRRVKNTMLTKIDKQIPEGKKSILILDNSYAFYDDHDILDAIYGQSCVVLNVNAHETRETRQPNGLIHHPKGKYVSGIISYSNDYSNRKLFLNPFATKRLLESEVCLFMLKESKNENKEIVEESLK